MKNVESFKIYQVENENSIIDDLEKNVFPESTHKTTDDIFNIEPDGNGTSFMYVSTKHETSLSEWALIKHENVIESQCLHDVTPFKEFETGELDEEDYVLYIPTMAENAHAVITKTIPGNPPEKTNYEDELSVEEKNKSYDLTLDKWEASKEYMEKDPNNLSIGHGAFVKNSDLDKAIKNVYQNDAERVDVEKGEMLKVGGDKLYITPSKLKAHENLDYSMIYESKDNSKSLVNELSESINNTLSKKKDNGLRP